MGLASPQRILADSTASRNHAWLTTGIRCVYQRDDDVWRRFEDLWEGECIQVERWKDDPLAATYRGRTRTSDGVFFFAGTDNQQLFDRIKESPALVDMNGVDGKVRSFFEIQAERMKLQFLLDIANVRKDGPLVLAGHSFGGVIALLLGIVAKNEGWTNVRVYTYGMPRPGNRDFNEGNAVIHYRSVLSGDGITEWQTDMGTPMLPPFLPGTWDVDAHSNHGRKWTLYPWTGETAEEDGVSQDSHTDAQAFHFGQFGAFMNASINMRLWVTYTRMIHPIRVYQAAWMMNNSARANVQRLITIDTAQRWPFVSNKFLTGTPENDVMMLKFIVGSQERLQGDHAHKMDIPFFDRMVRVHSPQIITRRMLHPNGAN